tara:strand:- start:30 stop:407 length:378 start_codon:yes stop_codon:yes gene_type:complete
MNIKTMFKYEEIKQHFLDYVKDNYTNLEEALEDEDLHHKVFNEDYYIIGYYQAEQWLIEDGKNNFNNSQNMTFDVLGYVMEQEDLHLGEIHTVIDNAETLVNHYTYWLGREIIEEIREEERQKVS